MSSTTLAVVPLVTTSFTTWTSQAKSDTVPDAEDDSEADDKLLPVPQPHEGGEHYIDLALAT